MLKLTLLAPEGMKIGQKIGVQGTPLLFINGSMVNGADINWIAQLLDHSNFFGNKSKK